MVSLSVGVCPPAKTPLVELSKLTGNILACVKSPKSVAFPTVAIVTYSIIFEFAAGSFFPPPTIALVVEFTAVKYSLSSLKFPKSAAFPVVAIST